ncbi:MAG: cupin-like domain-containing protein [Deltaproteobacteria bacterium]|nr:cupin-like domain-containing protein [Deltaproteobacteria bacterium]
MERVDLATFTRRIREAAPRAPVIVTDLAAEWPALTQWTHDSLRERLGLPAIGVGVALPEALAGEVAFPPFTRLRQQSNLWLARDGQISELHYDLPHNLNTVVRGDKEVHLFAPRERRNLYPCSAFGAFGALNSRVRLDEVGPAFPRVRRAHYWRTKVVAGETLYIPPFFWHHVRSGGESVAVNVWFHLEPRKFLRVLGWPRGALVTAAVNVARARLRGGPRA